MIINLKSTDKKLGYLGTSKDGHQLTLSSGKDGLSPMETVLMAVAGCSSIDIELILGKMRQKVDSVEVHVEGDRASEDPKVFEVIRIHYTLKGEIKESKARQAVELSMEKYCSVSLMLKGNVKLEYTFEIVE